MIMTYQALRSAFPAVTLANSFYIQQSKVKIRAINTRPQNASVPALYPAGIPTYEHALQNYTNVSNKIMDTINSVYKKNYKIVNRYFFIKLFWYTLESKSYIIIMQ